MLQIKEKKIINVYGINLKEETKGIFQKNT